MEHKEDLIQYRIKRSEATIEEAELVLKNNTTYLFQVLNNSVSTGWISPDLTWYEL